MDELDKIEKMLRLGYNMEIRDDGHTYFVKPVFQELSDELAHLSKRPRCTSCGAPILEGDLTYGLDKFVEIRVCQRCADNFAAKHGDARLHVWEEDDG